MADVYENELNELLKEDIVSARNRASTIFDPWEKKIKSHSVVLFGCGQFGKKILKGFRNIGIEPLAFSDNNQNIWGTETEGIKIYSPEEAANKFPNAVFMVTIWSDVIGHPAKEIEKQLHQYNDVEVISFFFLFWKYPDIFMPYFSIDGPDKTLGQVAAIKECFSLFHDDESRKEFVAQIRWRLQGDYMGLTEPGKFTQYFYDDLFTLNEEDVFVDCGAFDGDTLRNFIKKQQDRFCHYFALEPDPINFEKLRQYVAGLPSTISNKITVQQCAVSDSQKQISFSSNGSLQSSISDAGNILVDCISIDENIKGEDVTYIKMDAEGAEPDIISGSESTIKNNKPIIAISVYHQFDHLWQLPLQVKALSDNYSFYLRPHCKASWDLICYAVPENRLKTT
ncbi:MAG: FkbM family methyltransferase [Bacteroidota bacterium]